MWNGLTIEAAQAHGWACFWAALDEQAAEQIGEELKTGRRRDAMNLLWVLARDVFRYSTRSALDEADVSSAFAIDGSPGRGPDGTRLDA